MHGVETVLNVLGSVALLLWGVRMVRTGLTRAFGAALRRAIAACSRNRFTAFLGGIAVTGLLQSSTATSLLVSSFAGRGLIPLSIAFAIMLGADIGTTIAAQVLSFDLGWVSPPDRRRRHRLPVERTGQGAPSRPRRHRAWPDAAVAEAAGGATQPLRSAPAFMAMLQGLQDEYVIAVAVGTLATWFAHSSLSIVLLVMSFAGSGLIEPKLALALVIGANIGGALAPYMAQSGADVAAPRAARQPDDARHRRRGAAALPRPGRRLADPGRCLGDPPAGQLPHRLQRAGRAGLPAAGRRRRLGLPPVAARQAGPRRPGKPRHLDPNVLDSPAEALGCALRETLNLGDRVADMLRQTIDVLERNDPKAVKAIEAADNAVDQLYEAIKLYLVQVSRNELGEEDGKRYVEILTFRQTSSISATSSTRT